MGKRSSPRAGAAVTIAAEQRTRIKQYVVQHKVQSYVARERIAVGTTLPADVDLLAVRSEWGPDSAATVTCIPTAILGWWNKSSRRVIEVVE
ncbi:MAG: hypothetical protein WBW11_04895 [Pseudolabrys sp.]